MGKCKSWIGRLQERERDARPAGKQTKAEMTGIKNWDSISSTALHQEGYISSGNSTLAFFLDTLVALAAECDILGFETKISKSRV